MCGCFSCTPYWGPGLKPRHVPWLGIKPATLWFAGQHSIHWVTSARRNFLKPETFVCLCCHGDAHYPGWDQKMDKLKLATVRLLRSHLPCDPSLPLSAPATLVSNDKWGTEEVVGNQSGLFTTQIWSHKSSALHHTGAPLLSTTNKIQTLSWGPVGPAWASLLTMTVDCPLGLCQGLQPAKGFPSSVPLHMLFPSSLAILGICHLLVPVTSLITLYEVSHSGYSLLGWLPFHSACSAQLYIHLSTLCVSHWIVNSLLAKSFYLLTLLIHCLAQHLPHSWYSVINICIELIGTHLHPKGRKEVKKHHLLTQGWKEGTVKWGYQRTFGESPAQAEKIKEDPW